ncbi:hypothetical protein [Melaminivora alkalimesophila]|uniref:Uncharacterized protein n=1 Tax=Melaminivora alkalimesophila TaxID=1165852 RepID=A0A317RDP3_9BURK|nr:hypothetical protein [Melaminivora alkalimesophila]PWW47683.1 hypothetical protein DFR36_10256 [Melaminivora alkalimesophila]
MKPDGFGDSEWQRISLGQALRSQRARRRWQQVLGVALLLAGYVCLAVPADTPGDWLLLRVAGGFLLLFAGFAVAIGPLVSAILGTDHE